MWPSDTLVVADRTTAGKILSSARRRSGLRYLVSIGGPRDRKPAGFRFAPERIRLVFDDVLSEQDGGPSPRDIEQLIEFARRVDPSRGRVLVHCQAGISRSAAAAVILLAVVAGPGREAEALRYTLAVRPLARPNLRMLELADELLATGGALVQALRSLTSAAP